MFTERYGILTHGHINVRQLKEPSAALFYPSPFGAEGAMRAPKPAPIAAENLHGRLHSISKTK